MSEQTEDNLIALCKAFEALYPYAGFYFGHIVIQDHNFDLDSVNWAIEHLDTNSWNSARRNHPDTTTEETNRWRRAALDLLTLIKTTIEP